MIRSARSRSLYSSDAGGLVSLFFTIDAHSRVRKPISCWISFLLTPSHAVRMMKPPCAGRNSLTAARSRARSSALSIRRETPR